MAMLTLPFSWKQVGIMKTDGGAPDRCEFYALLQDDILGNIPAKQHAPPLQRRKDAAATFLREATRILQRVLAVLDAHLGLPIGTFAERMSPERTSGTLLRLIRYAPQPHGDRRTALLSHTDMGCITFLCSVLGGLQILQPGGDPAHESDWRYIRPRPGCAIINIGDALVEWSGGILRSNMHRVTYAPGAQAECTRYSLAYLVRANKDVSMKRLTSERIPTADEDEEEDLDISCEQWELEKSKALTAGADCARSRGGRELNFPLTSPTPVKV
jgi:isopenicillin N synthase-like dioxygenase